MKKKLKVASKSNIKINKKIKALKKKKINIV